MFKKIFGGSSKKEEKPQQAPQQPPPPKNTSIEFEKTTYEIQRQEEAFEKKIEKFTNMIDMLRNQAKEYIKQGKKKNAQFKLSEIQQLEKYITRAENQKQVFFKVRMQLQHGLENKNAADTLSQAAKLLKTVDTDALQDALEDINDLQEQQQEVDQLFEQNAGVGVDQDDLDNMMQDLENEIQQENVGGFKNQINNMPNANVNRQQQSQYQPQQQYGQQQQQQQQYQQKNKDAFNDALLEQLAL